jgi:UDP-N-acetylglucosamine 1-carboxyvinyltransferase
VRIDAGKLTSPEAPYELVKTMRASVLALGPLLARFGEATVSLPGGCAIGSRPVDQHIKGLQAMGAEIVVEHGYMIAKLPKGWTRLKGASITTDMVTVTGTENFLMAASAGRGRDHPGERGAGARDHRPGRNAHQDGRQDRRPRHRRIRIQGVEKLHGCTHQVVADRIECRHLPVRGGGRRRRRCAQARPRRPPRRRDRQAARRRRHRDGGRRRHPRAGSAAAEGAELPHHRIPRFPDRHAGAVHGAQLHRRGRSKVTETIFENRFMHVNEMVRLGAKIDVDGKVAVIEGVERLSGATVMATDLRASASLVIAGLVADGETLVDRIYHLDRGYDQMEAKLRGIGADIERSESMITLALSKGRIFDETCRC